MNSITVAEFRALNLKQGAKKKCEHKEDNELIHVCEFIKLQYQNVIFFCDVYDRITNKGLRMKLKHLRSGSNPDLFICEPENEFKGLFIEFKKTGTVLYKKDGSFASKHLERQNSTINRLMRKGYFATFAIGKMEAIKIIKNYLE